MKQKLSVRENGKNHDKIARGRLKDKGRVAMRIDEKTIILVKPENKTEAYKRAYKKKIDYNRWVETRCQMSGAKYEEKSSIF